jgi:hypothetical protein
MLHLRRNHGTEAVESTGTRHRVRTVVKAALAATTGWLLVNVVRKVRRTSDASATSNEPDGAGAAGADDEPAARHTSGAEPPGASATKANTSSA